MAKKNIIDKPKKAALYSRLSSDDGRDGESNSITNQKILLERTAKEYGFNNFEHYVDDGYSGTNMNRPAFQKLKQDIINGEISVLIVKDSSRIGRQYIEVGDFTEIFLPKHDVRLIKITDGTDSAKGDDRMDPIRNVFNDIYAQDISMKRKAANLAKGGNGEPLSPPPYGYMKKPDNPKFWIIDKPAAETVKNIFDWYNGGMGTHEIADKLNEMNIMTPLMHAEATGRRKGGRKNSNPLWNQSSVVSILEKQEYCGDILNFKTFSKSYRLKQRFKSDEKDILIFKDVHEPIISREDFERAKERRGKSRVRKKADGSKNIFSGLLECGGCGSNLNYHFAQNNPEREYFNCANYNNGRGCDNPHHIRMDFLTAAVLKSINSLTFFAQENDEYFEKYIQEKSNAANNEEINSLRSEVRDIEYRINKIDNIIANLYEDNLDGKISDERFASMTRKYETEQIELRNNFEIKNRKLIELENKDSDCKSFMETVKKYTKPTKLTRTMLCELIEKIVVFPAEKNNGVSVQRLNIYYRCIGSFEFDELGPEPEWNILIETRPGVILTDTVE